MWNFLENFLEFFRKFLENCKILFSNEILAAPIFPLIHLFSRYFLENSNAPNPTTSSPKLRLPQGLPTSAQVLISRTYTSTGQPPHQPSPAMAKATVKATASPRSLLASQGRPAKPAHAVKKKTPNESQFLENFSVCAQPTYLSFTSLPAGPLGLRGLRFF